MAILKNRKIYSRYYGEFRGVDFSSDHTQVDKSRLAYLVNMYRDYKSGQGKALETVPGFRRRVNVPGGAAVYGIHKSGENVYIHAGKRLYRWNNYPLSIGIELSMSVMLDEEESELLGVKTFEIELPEEVYSVVNVKKADGEDITENTDFSDGVLTVSRSDLVPGNIIYVTYTEGALSASDALFGDMAERESISFVMYGRLYIIDGKNYLSVSGNTAQNAADTAYVPTTYINIIPAGENADAGAEYEQRNMLTPKFKHTFIADGETLTFQMNESDLESIDEVKVYGETVDPLNYTKDLTHGKIRFTTAPQSPTDAGYPDMYAGIEITASKAVSRVSGITSGTADVGEIITGCTLAAIYDNRVFLTGNPAYPEHVFFSGRNAATGLTDPTYFGILNYIQDGVGTSVITGIMPAADALMVLKSGSERDGAIYYHVPSDTGNDILPRTYPSTKGASGIGCIGACLNFRDDPVFLSRLGVEAVGKVSAVRYERAIEHRSTLIDAKLLTSDLEGAKMCEYGGYLVLMTKDGRIFLADSRQAYENERGALEYEWYYLENIGIYSGQYTEWKYADNIYPEFDGATVSYISGGEELTAELRIAKSVYSEDSGEYEDRTGTTANAPDDAGNETQTVYEDIVEVTIDGETVLAKVYFTAEPDESGDIHAYLCESEENKTGGIFHPAIGVYSLDDNLFFGTASGQICSFNFDMRDADGSIPVDAYTFDGRTIISGCATKMDCCDVPHLNKSTIKKSTVIKTKTFPSSAAKVKVRTNKKPYRQIARIMNSTFSFDSIDFGEFTFIVDDKNLFSVKEKEKHWVEKQYYIYSDEYKKPFALYYISFRYNVSGRYKE